MKKFYVFVAEHLPSHQYYIGCRAYAGPPERDQYLGSGTIWQRLIKVHPRASFRKTIIGVFQSQHEASRVESAIISDPCNLNDRCMNVKDRYRASPIERMTPRETAHVVKFREWFRTREAPLTLPQGRRVDTKSVKVRERQKLDLQHVPSSHPLLPLFELYNEGKSCEEIAETAGDEWSASRISNLVEQKLFADYKRARDNESLQ